jgi:hypothetical protein
LTEPKITLKRLLEFGYEKENNLPLDSPKKGKLTVTNDHTFNFDSLHSNFDFYC